MGALKSLTYILTAALTVSSVYSQEEDSSQDRANRIQELMNKLRPSDSATQSNRQQNNDENKNNSYAKRAILINGDTEKRHKRNIQDAYDTLVSLGWDKDNIIALSTNCPAHKSCGNNCSTTLSCTQANIESTLEAIALDATPESLIFVYTTGHGGRRRNGVDLRLKNENITPEEIFPYLNNIQAGCIIGVHDQCYSGGFAEKFKGITASPYLGMSSIDAKNSIECEKFIPAFWKALKEAGKSSADTNQDGAVSFKEAWKWASGGGGGTGKGIYVYSTEIKDALP